MFDIFIFCSSGRVNVGNVLICDCNGVMLRMSKYRDTLKGNSIFIITKI